MLASRVAKLVALRRSERASRKIAIVIFNFPPNAGNTGTAAYLSVFESLYQVLKSMGEQGYTVEIPESVDALRDSIILGNKDQYGTDANVHTLISADDHVRRETWLSEIEAQWGPAPGQHLSNGASLFVLGRQFGNVVVTIQPGMGYEGDPMRLLFEHGFAPTHAFCANYRYLREDFRADAFLHFGTHGALEFMPGKQAGMSGACWPDRLIADVPNFYLYASNNPSEGAIAKRRAGATLISYLTPPVAQAGLYRGLVDLKSSIDRFRKLEPHADERIETATVIQAQAAELNLVAAEPLWSTDRLVVQSSSSARKASTNGESEADLAIQKLTDTVREMEYTLIPHGLHVVGLPLSIEERIDMLTSMADATSSLKISRESAQLVVDSADADCVMAHLCEVHDGLSQEDARHLADQLVMASTLLEKDTEVDGILHALDGRYIRPAPGGDLLRSPEVLPTGRNLHGFDPFQIPSAVAVRDGALQAQRLLDR